MTDSGEKGRVVDEIGPIDPDVSLTVDYLSGEATPEQREEFERRFVNDDAFAEFVGPLIKAWNLPFSFRSASDMPAKENGAPASQASRGAGRPVAGAGLPGSRRDRITWLANTTLKFAVAATLLLTVATYGYIFAFNWINPGRAKVLAEGRQQFDSIRAAKRVGQPSAASVLPPLPAPRAGASQRPSNGIAPSFADTALKVRPPETSTAIPKVRPVPDSMRVLTDMMQRAIIAAGQEVRTGPGESKLIELTNGSRVLLRENTVLRYLGLPGIKTTVNVYVEGEIVVELPVIENGIAMTLILTPGGVVLPKMAYEGVRETFRRIPTIVSVRSFSGQAEAEVVVASGEAWVMRAVADDDRFTAKRGDAVLLSRTAGASRVSAERAAHFPVANLALPRQP